MDLSGHLKQLEASLLTYAVRSDADHVSRLLADDFREFGSSGRIFTKREIIAALQEENHSVPSTLIDFEFCSLSEGVVLVTYRTRREIQNGPAADSVRSSIWIVREERWQMLFYQGTRITPLP